MELGVYHANIVVEVSIMENLFFTLPFSRPTCRRFYRVVARHIVPIVDAAGISRGFDWLTGYVTGCSYSQFHFEN